MILLLSLDYPGFQISVLFRKVEGLSYFTSHSTLSSVGDLIFSLHKENPGNWGELVYFQHPPNLPILKFIMLSREITARLYALHTLPHFLLTTR